MVCVRIIIYKINKQRLKKNRLKHNLLVYNTAIVRLRKQSSIKSIIKTIKKRLKDQNYHRTMNIISTIPTLY